MDQQPLSDSSVQFHPSQNRRLSDAFELSVNKEESKIGHRRVLENGSVTYKKRSTTELMTAIQLGISQSIGSLSSKPTRDILYEDFSVVVTVNFPKEGTNLTPAHHCCDFKFRTYAPDVFRYFRNLFKIKPIDFLLALSSDPLRELPNPGASGSIFYVTASDEFIIKTVQHKEAEFLQKLLPGYYMNLNQNLRTLLPKFYGFFCYQSGGKNIRFVVMNNIISSDISLSHKFDLKGSTYKRKASKHEKCKPVPTLKDLDFVEEYPAGILLEPETYDALVKTLDRDCRVLESFKIMDYSLLMGIHNHSLDQEEVIKSINLNSESSEASKSLKTDDLITKATKTRIGQYSTALESINASQDCNSGQIPAKNNQGHRLSLYIGIIDVLQSYRLSKKLEHAFKSVVHDGDSVSVHHPKFYCQRFKKFCTQIVFKTSKPNKRKSMGGRKSLLSGETEPPNGKQSVKSENENTFGTTSYSSSSSSSSSSFPSVAFSSSQTTLPKHNKLGKTQASSSSSSYLSVSSLRTGGTSTPTNTYYTDATLSFTESSPSISADCLLDEPYENPNSLIKKNSKVKSREKLEHFLNINDIDIRDNNIYSSLNKPLKEKSFNKIDINEKNTINNNSNQEVTEQIFQNKSNLNRKHNNLSQKGTTSSNSSSSDGASYILPTLFPSSSSSYSSNIPSYHNSRQILRYHQHRNFHHSHPHQFSSRNFRTTSGSLRLPSKSPPPLSLFSSSVSSSSPSFSFFSSTPGYKQPVIISSSLSPIASSSLSSPLSSSSLHNQYYVSPHDYVTKL